MDRIWTLLGFITLCIFGFNDEQNKTDPEAFTFWIAVLIHPFIDEDTDFDGNNVRV